MAQPDIDRIRDGFAEWKRTRELDLDLLHREIDLLIHGTPAGDVSYKGRDGFREWLDQRREVAKAVSLRRFRLQTSGRSRTGSRRASRSFLDRAAAIEAAESSE